MRFNAILSILLAFLTASAVATAPLKAVIVSYKQETPDSIVEQAMEAIKEAGGQITHTYNIFKGFAANAPATVLDNVQAWGNKWNAVVEEDAIVTTNEHGEA